MPDNIEIVKNAFPSHLKDEIDAIIKAINIEKEVHLSMILPFEIIIDNEKLCIPGRHLFYDIDLPEKLTTLQKEILYCFYTRHGDGHIREKYLRKIISSNHKWVTPYVIALLGEYVIEILQVIFENLDRIKIDDYMEIIEDNPAFYALTKERVISYWDYYYRWKYKLKKDYVGFKILDYLDTKRSTKR
jgi:hypothetical protein